MFYVSSRRHFFSGRCSGEPYPGLSKMWFGYKTCVSRMGERRPCSLTALLLILFVSGGRGQKESHPVLTDPDLILYRGQVGVIPCSYERDVLDVMWKRGESPLTADTLVVLDKHRGGLRSGQGYEQGMFNMTDEYSLIINDVRVEDEGIYYCEVADRALEFAFRNNSNVTVVEMTSDLSILQCDYSEPDRHSAGDLCTYNIPRQTPNISLVCMLHGFKPNVQMYWTTSGRFLPLLESSQEKMINGTFKRNVTIMINTQKGIKQQFVCVAEGLAVNGTISTSITVFSPPVEDHPSDGKAPLTVALGVALGVVLAVGIICHVVFLFKCRTVQSSIDLSSAQDALLNRPRNELFEKAKRAECEDNIHDLRITMKAMVEQHYPLSRPERDLLATAYRKAVDGLLTEYSSISVDNRDISDSKRTQRWKSYEMKIKSFIRSRKKKQAGIKGICDEILAILKKIISKHHPGQAEDDLIDDLVFYLTMRGEFYTYMAEIENGDTRMNFVKKALSTYARAMHLGKSKLPPGHPTTLNVVLRFSHLYSAILEDFSGACNLIESAIKDAQCETNSLDVDLQKDRARIMELLEQDLQLWKEKLAIEESGENGPLTTDV